MAALIMSVVSVSYALVYNYEDDILQAMRMIDAIFCDSKLFFTFLAGFGVSLNSTRMLLSLNI